MSKCTGLKFRAKTSTYFNGKKMSFEHRETLTLLKRESCKCEECTHALKEIKDGGSDLVDFVHWRIFSNSEDREIEDGGTYRAKPKWECFDTGCGVTDLEFFEVKK